MPAVHESTGADLVMERVIGATMLDAFGRRPWRLRWWAKLLASLHDELARVPMPRLDLPIRFGRPETLVHADLHPDNVMLTGDGPVVIDWTNVGLGPRGADVANTWLIVAASELDSTGPRRVVQSAARSFFLQTFLDHADRELARSVLREAAEHRLTDRNVRPGEALRIGELVRDEVDDDEVGGG